MNKIAFYFQTFLTENEHSIVKHIIQEYCSNNELELVYYRYIEPHIPMFREAKIIGTNTNITKFKKYMDEVEKIDIFNIFQNHLNNGDINKKYLDIASKKIYNHPKIKRNIDYV